MPISVFPTLSAAGEIAKQRPRRTVALILGLEGARYYLFFSKPDIMQHMAINMINTAMDIEFYAKDLRDNQLLSPRYVKSCEAINKTGNGINRAIDYAIRNTRADMLKTKLRNEAKRREIEDLGGHAEMYLISSWKECLMDFLSYRKRNPRHAEIFLSNSPCQHGDERPSPEMIVDGVLYPESCRSKLYTFFLRYHSIHWRICYLKLFGKAEKYKKEYYKLKEDFPGILIDHMEELEDIFGPC